jgi:GT2 family glycosyltransferase
MVELNTANHPQKTEASIAIVLLNWNNKRDTLACLQSLAKLEYDDHEVIVVDNGSIDDSVATIRQQFESVLVIETGANLGFSAGNNVGIAAALERGADYVFLLNNDTTVSPDILDRFLEVSQSLPQVGVLGAKIYFFDQPDRLWYAGAQWRRDTGRFVHRGIMQLDDRQSWNQVEETAYACGCALFIRARVLRDIGLLDPNYFLMWEETDLCFRARAKGYGCLFVPQAIVWHKVSASFGGVSPLWQYFYQRNRLLWLQRHLYLVEPDPWQRFQVWFRVWREFIGIIRRLINPKLGEDYRQEYRIKFVAYKDYLLRRFGDCPPWIRTVPISRE